MNDIKKLRQRFVKDYNLPINIYEDELFDYYKGLYDFFPKDIYEGVLKKVRDEFDGNVELWLEYCAKVRDYAINNVLNSESYKAFNTSDMSKYSVATLCSSGNCFNEAMDGRRFISIDIKKANFQMMKAVGVITDDTYEDFIERYGADDYIKGSKYLRQVIFGKLNPSRTITVAKYYAANIAKAVMKNMESNGFKLYSILSDEVVFLEKERYNFSVQFLDTIVETVKSLYGIDVRAEYIGVRRLPIVNCRGNKVNAYERTNLFTNEQKLKGTSAIFFPQVYKLWKGQKIEEKDLVFFAEDQLATFKEPLKKNEIID